MLAGNLVPKFSRNLLDEVHNYLLIKYFTFSSIIRACNEGGAGIAATRGTDLKSNRIETTWKSKAMSASGISTEIGKGQFTDIVYATAFGIQTNSAKRLYSKTKGATLSE